MFTKETRHRFSWLALTILLTFTLAACGANINGPGSTKTGSVPGGSTSTTTTSTTAPKPTATHGQANTVTGCPNHATITTQPAAASVVLKNFALENPTIVKQGDTVEVDLPFGHNWGGPINSAPNLLVMQNPSGYASPEGQVCVWRFVAASTGTVDLTFTGRPICEQGKLCPAYVMAAPFTIKIQ